MGAALLLVLASLPGCAFQRVVTNEGVRGLDTSGIVAGETDIVDVIFQVGLPPSDAPEEIGTRGVGRDFLRYAVFDRRCFRIGFEQIFLITPFRWCSEAYTYDLSFEFDERGIVQGVYETERENRWRPFQSEKSDRPIRVEQRSGGLLR